jgi:mannose-1-phosphate guanylyltransferase
MMNAFLVIMAGGSGTRFWPKSTSRRPKQLLAFDLEGKPGRSLIAETAARFEGIVPKGNGFVVTTRLLEDAIRTECPGLTILAEPQGRNTAPCVYWAAREIAKRDPEGVMLVMPADHYIANVKAFRTTVRQAAERALKHGELITLGVLPTRPETGYGYLRMGASVGECAKVDAFVEKPDFERAKEFVKNGYLWNGGMFAWRASEILKAFDEFMPELGKVWNEARGDAQVAYPKMTATSIDFGVMERAKNVVTFQLDCGWDDLGSWLSLESLAERLGRLSPEGVVTGGELVAVDSKRNVVDAPGRLVALLGIDDLIVVEHGDALLVARKDRAQDIRLIVEQVKKRRPELA